MDDVNDWGSVAHVQGLNDEIKRLRAALEEIWRLASFRPAGTVLPNIARLANAALEDRHG